MAISVLNTATAIGLYLVVSTLVFIHFRHSMPSLSITSLLIFNNLNIFISYCEICLGRHILHIQSDYKKLRSKYQGNEWGACIQYLTMPLTIEQCFDGRIWSKMWSTYALYDPSYQNHESFGFFIDFGNGMSTIPPSLLMNLAIVWYMDDTLSPLLVGCVGIAMYWQVLYGTLIYILSFVFNKRYEGKSLTEVVLFVGLTNGIWFVFPIIGIWSCVIVLRDGNLEVFQ